MQLFLLRHGDYVAESIDPSCPLSVEGKRDIELTAHFLRERKFRIDYFCHSSKQRAIDSARIMRDVLNPSATMEMKKHLSPSDNPDDIIYDIAGWRVNSMIVGHLPFLARLAARLVVQDDRKAIVSLPTSAVVILENDQEQNWYISGFLTPRLIGK